MHIVFDNMFYYSPRTRTKVACHLKILAGDTTTLTIATEVQNNHGWSIARFPEILAAQAVNAFQLDPNMNRYIEHYPAPDKHQLGNENTLVRSIEAYFLVNFTWQTTNATLFSYTATQPQRQTLSVVDFVRLMRTVYTSKQNSF